MSESNAEIAERVAIEILSASNMFDLDDLWPEETNDMIKKASKPLQESINRGDLIPKERLMTVEEIKIIVGKWFVSKLPENDDDYGITILSNLIHSAMVQKSRNS